MQTDTLIAALRAQIGTQVSFHNETWTFIDIVNDDSRIVLERCGHHSIQADQHGQGHRRTLTTTTLPIFDDAEIPHALLRQLGLGLPKP